MFSSLLLLCPSSSPAAPLTLIHRSLTITPASSSVYSTQPLCIVTPTVRLLLLSSPLSMTSGPIEPVAAAGPGDGGENAVENESASRTNKVLMVGGDKVGKRYILQRLLNRTTLPIEPLSLDISGADSLTVDTVEWPVDTRYYTTSLQFHVLRDSSVPRFSPDSLSALLASPLLSSTSSVVLVYDASSVDSLRAIQRWSAVTAQVDDEDSVMLCVGVEKVAGGGKEEVWDEARDWCIDHTIGTRQTQVRERRGESWRQRRGRKRRWRQTGGRGGRGRH